jgi:predicted ATPase
MPLTDLRIAGYRSIREIRFPLRQLSVLVGSNGVGKTNLYRSVYLLHAAATGTLADEIAGEGGLASIFWAGDRKKSASPRIELEVDLDDLTFGQPELGTARYQIEIGFPTPTTAAFQQEAMVKAETLSIREKGRWVKLMERKAGSAWARDANGKLAQVSDQMLSNETALSTLRGGYPEIDAVRHVLASWRFYHGFRTDKDALLRRPALAVTAPMLTADGSNLAAVFATLRHIRQDSVDPDEAIEAAFPGAVLDVPMPTTTAEFSLTFPDLPWRSFGAAELSDGTLHFLALMGALLSYRLPPFIALNEPETSLHPDLLPALAKIIAKAATRSQIWLVTHSRELADAVAQETGVIPRSVIRADGATWLEGLNQIGAFADDD